MENWYQDMSNNKWQDIQDYIIKDTVKNAKTYPQYIHKSELSEFIFYKNLRIPEYLSNHFDYRLYSVNNITDFKISLG